VAADLHPPGGRPNPVRCLDPSTAARGAAHLRLRGAGEPPPRRCQAPRLSDTWREFKSFTARRLIDLLEEHRAKPLLERLHLALKAERSDRGHQLWQEGSHPQCIQGEEMLRQKLDYIHNNPVKRGFVDEPEHWRWSSARNDAGREGMIEVFTGW
jgi:putative transposase